VEQLSLIEDWIDRYTQRLVRLAYTYVRDWSAAEDRLQDAFIKAYQKIDTFRTGSDPFPWLAKIVVNECKMSKRRSWREMVTDLLPDQGVASSEDEFFRVNDKEQLFQVIFSLPESMRSPIILYYFEELSVEQIADILKTKTGTVKSRLSRGRERVRKICEEDGYGTAFRECKETL
jgi:RNA polymerase sigma-70 factor, ECF subfamily